MKNFRKIFVLLALVLTLAMVFASCSKVESTDTTASKTEAPATESRDPVGTEAPDTPDVPEASKLYIKMFKCGKADSFLIRTENKAVLIDTGEDDDYEKILAYMEEKEIKKIDYLIITQFNKNHTGSTGAILSAVDVETVLEPAYAKSGTSYSVYKDALNKAGKTAEQVSSVKELSIDGATLKIYPCEASYNGTDMDEYNSFVITLSYLNNNVLFAGDIFGARITEVSEKLAGKTFDIVKVPNHGIYSSKLDDFVKNFSGKYAVITASDKNPADSRVVSLYENAGSKVYITKDGAVEVRLCEGYYQIKQSEDEWNTVNK